MATYTKAVGTYETIHPDWETAKDWAKATFTKERMTEAALCIATVSLIGVVAVSLHRAMESYLVMGF